MLTAPTMTVIGAMLGLALLSTALAYIIYFRLLSTAGATNLLLVTFLIPVSAIVLGVSILDERLEIYQFVGMAIIGISLIVIDGRVLIALLTRLSGLQPIQPLNHRSQEHIEWRQQ
jgi:drug/metabolite transporter (DMT)-like permease